MNPHEISLVRASFDQLRPVADQAAALFHARLFELEPTLRERFSGDIEAHSRKLVELLGSLVAELDRADSLVPAIKSLGLRISGPRVTDWQCANVGLALLWTLEKCLGPHFTPAARDAWSGTYALLANILVESQRSRIAA